VIADVAGKSKSRRTAHGHVSGEPAHHHRRRRFPGELVTRLNRYATAHSLDGRRFTTAFSPNTIPATAPGIHKRWPQQPILRRKDGGIVRLETGGVPLGIDLDSDFEVGSIDLASGDLLLLFTG